MKLVVDIPENDEQPRAVLERRLIAGVSIQVQGFSARVVGTVDERYEPLLPYLTGNAG